MHLKSSAAISAPPSPCRPCEACGEESFRPLFRTSDYVIERCVHCGLLRLNPQPDDATLQSIYGAHYFSAAWGTGTDAARVLALKQATFWQHVLPAAPLGRGARILDCGAAYGALMEAAQLRGWEPYGIELADSAAAAIGRRFGAERIFSGPFEDAVFPGRKEGDFDAVFMCDFIEHVRDPAAVLRKAGRWLRPGGFLVITTPDADSLSRRLMGPAWPHFKTEHLHYFGRVSLGCLLNRCGFASVACRRACKVLDLEYLDHQFKTYPRRWITPIITGMAALAGQRLRHRPLAYSFGEIIMSATKV